MAKKKHKKTTEKHTNTEVNNKKQTAVDTDMRTDEANPEQHIESSTETTTSKESDLQQKLDEINDKYLRLYSEYDNYRKRTSKEKLDLVKTASSEVIKELLPVLDDMERAIKSSEEATECQSLKEGFILIHNKLRSTLEKKGLKVIESVGETFDTDFHEAITFIPAPSEDLKGKVVEEVEKGYLLNEKVIRYTKAVIGQ
ncbi:MAG: nucleotide exchange factor GrpE [Bacteroidales bacterium]|nr:nucleotide exchange factor GrpE [Bacteroidales bacterium]